MRVHPIQSMIYGHGKYGAKSDGGQPSASTTYTRSYNGQAGLRDEEVGGYIAMDDAWFHTLTSTSPTTARESGQYRRRASLLQQPVSHARKPVCLRL